MSQLLRDVLANRNYSEPPEIQRIKRFVFEETGITPNVSITTDAYIVQVTSAAAAGTLRSKIYPLQKQLGDSRRIIIRIR